LDAVSLVPVLEDPNAKVRDFAFADAFGAQRVGVRDQRAIRTARYKLFIDKVNDIEALYDLSVDPYEAVNLLDDTLSDEAQANYDDLNARLEALYQSHTP